jgi:hypothetical protein
MDAKRYFFVALTTFARVANASDGVNVAIVKLNDEGKNYIYSAKKISPGDKVYFQFPRDDAPSCCARSDWRSTTSLPPDPDAVDYDTDRELYRYRLVAPGMTSSLPFLGIAAIGKNLTVAPAGVWQVNVGKGVGSTGLKLCTSQEGVHVVSQADGKSQSHLYLYLGYDIENTTCESMNKANVKPESAP